MEAHRVHQPRLWRRRLATATVVVSWLAFLCLLFWVPAQMFLTMMVLNQPAAAGVACADLPRVELLAVTGGALASALLALVLIKRRWPAALLAVAAAAACVAAWVSIGGFEAFDCVTNL